MYKREDILTCKGTEFCDICKSDCNKVHQMSDWKTSLEKNFFIGALVSQDIAEECCNVLPPTTLRGDLLQMGEPYSHEPDASGKYRATYATFALTSEGWTYAGNCFKGETKNR